MSELDIDALIRAYIALRDKKAEVEKQAKEQKKILEAKQDKILQVLDKHLTAKKLKSLKSNSGTAFKKKKAFVNVEDWTNFIGFIAHECMLTLFDGHLADRELEPGLALKQDKVKARLIESAPWEFFQRNVSKSAVISYLEETEGFVPPGIKYTTENVVEVRR